MKKKLFAACCLLMLLLPLPGLILHRPDLLNERREENVQEALGFKREMLSAHAFLSRLIGMSGSGQVTLGKDGTLFLSETLPAHVGAEPLSDGQIEAIARELKAADTALRERGAYLIFLCAPDKAGVMRSALPYYALPRSGGGALDRLYALLDAENVAYLDARPLLAEDSAPYLRTDTHWSGPAAARIYRALMEKLPPAAWETYADAPWTGAERQGDLTALIDPGYGEKETVLTQEIPRTYQTRGMMRSVMDLRIETACGRNGLRVVMLRDSFANSLFPYLANNIGNLRMIRASRWEDAYWGDGADAVILEIAERNLKSLCPDP